MYRRRRRTGFTLLEVLLSLSIALLLFAGLYVAVDVQLRNTQAGRERIEHGTLARFLITRLVNDLAPNLAPPLPTPGAAAADPTGGATTPTAWAGGAEPATGAEASTATTTGALAVNVGVQGDNASLTVSITRLPAAVDPTRVESENENVTSDLRRVVYWMTDGGLARREFTLVTSDEATGVASEVQDEAAHVIAPEVKSLEIAYFDGSAWQSSWDGTQPGPDGATPMGPPRAIAVTLGLALPGREEVRTFRHVIEIPTANGAAQAAADATGTSTNNGQ